MPSISDNLQMPVMSQTFLSKSDREWIITIVNTIVGDMPVEGMKNLLRGILPNETIDRINFHEGSRNIAEQMVARLEPSGALDSGDHALGKFLVDLIDTDKVNPEVAVRLQGILSDYKLLKNNRQISAWGSRLQISY